MSDDPIAALAEELASALQPLVAALGSPGALRDLLARLGWNLPAAPAALDSLRAPVEQVFHLVDSAPDGSDVDPGALLAGVRAAYTAITGLRTAPGLDPQMADELPRQLLDHLLVGYLLGHQPQWGHLLQLLGVIRIEDVPAAGGRPAYERRSIAFERLGDLLGDPITFLRDTYRFGQSDFRGTDLADALAALLDSWGLAVRVQLLDPQVLDRLGAGALTPEQTSETQTRLVLVESGNDPDVTAGVGLYLLPETATAKPGFALLPFAGAGVDVEIPLTDSLVLDVDAHVDMAGGVGVLVRPGQDVELLLGLGGGAPGGASGTLAIALRLAAPGEPVVLIGSPDGSRLDARGVSTTGGTRFHSDGRFEVFTEFALNGARIVIRPASGESDSFLGTLLPADGLVIPADLVVGFSTTQGLYFGGSGGLEVAIPAHLQIGPVEIVSALLGVKPDAGAVRIDLGATIAADLGVLSAVVENLGLSATVTFPEGGGNLGPADLALGFLPPKGVGLAIDAGVVKGGGYLYLDPDKGEYAGALELTVGDFLSLNAIGLITTKLPGGAPGFSMLVIITAQFSPGFQLGYGFTLIGVGGLLGLNRGMLVEPLAHGIRTGAVDNVLFPTDVVANAPRILSDLRTIFPPKPGTFLIGPMAKIGWGTPTLISVALGVIIEIPGNIVVLGRLKLALPTEDEAVVVLQLSFLGVLEPDKRRVWFFASLYESRILFIALDGEMGLLMDFGDDPDFVLTVGGFHPRYRPPPLPFPSPARLSLSLIDESWARVRVESYVALTTNTVQLGARAEAFFGLSALSVEGWFGFDALLRFSPFSFVVEISTGFSVKVFGIGVFGVHLRGALEGPTPWHITGSASISLLFFSVSVDVDETFGERRAEVLPPLPVLPALRAELEKLDTWKATLPGGRQLVALRRIGDPSLLVLHPVGTLQVSQRFVPLGQQIDKVGNQKPSDITRADVTVDAGGVVAVRGPARERFAVAQYREMDDAAKLSAPAFEMLPSGVELGAAGDAWVTGPSSTRSVRYESVVLDTAAERSREPYAEIPPDLFDHFRGGGAISRSELSLARETRLAPFDAKVDVRGDEYVVASQVDNTAVSGLAPFASHAEAAAHLRTTLAGDPRLAGSFHVIPRAEVNVVA